jgi:hypothetical protein
MATLVRIAIGIPVLAAVGLLVALVACALRRWSIAKRSAGAASLTGLCGFALIFGVCLLTWSTPGAAVLILPGAVSDPNLDPAHKARALAESISLMMNSAALACLVAAGGAAVWLLVRWRLRLGQKSAA